MHVFNSNFVSMQLLSFQFEMRDFLVFLENMLTLLAYQNQTDANHSTELPVESNALVISNRGDKSRHPG